MADRMRDSEEEEGEEEIQAGSSSQVTPGKQNRRNQNPSVLSKIQLLFYTGKPIVSMSQ